MPISRSSQTFWLVVLPLALFPFTLLLQLELGYEVSLFPLYMISIGALTWRFGLLGGFLAVSAATGFWVWGYFLTDTIFRYKWTVYYNAATRLVVFSAMVIFVHLFRLARERQERLMRGMRELLNTCHGCGAIQGSDGRWIPLGELEGKHGRVVSRCPICARAAAEFDDPDERQQDE